MKSALFAFAALVLVAQPAAAADLPAAKPASSGSWSHGLPACDNPSVIGRIVKRQHWVEKHSFPENARIDDVVEPEETASRFPSVSAIETRHCRATAALDDGSRARLYYTIAAEMGFAGIRWGVDFCIARQDRSYVYAPDCQVLR